jgi:HSP20 family protein
MADVKIQRGKHEGSQEERGMERHRAGTPARMGDWWTQDLFTMNPFALMRRMQEEMDRAFASSFGLWRGRGGEETPIFAPPIEVRQEDHNLVVSADLPGMSKEDVRIECTEDALHIEGERRREHEETSGGVHRSERCYGRFQRSIPLPEGAEVDKASAQFKDGVLEVRVPVPEQQRKAREIPIKT